MSDPFPQVKKPLRHRLPTFLGRWLRRAVVRVVGAAIYLIGDLLDIAVGNGLDLERLWPKELKHVKWPWASNGDRRDERWSPPQRPARAPHDSPDGDLIGGKGLKDFLLLMDALGGIPVAATPKDQPRASIIIPVFNQADYTFNCLWSLLREVDLKENEIVVVNDGSSDETARLLAHFSRFVKVVNNDTNLGFVEACNRGARASRGRSLVFLNNDTVVSPGWLEALVETAEGDPSVGAVGSMLVGADGSLREAGCVVWRDASAWNYGRGEDASDRRFAHAREVDYCSAASLLVRRSLFEELGGFDARYAPAYYEDADLCFGVRSLGFKVVYQPASRVVHHEGATAGTDTSAGFKRFQEINRHKFAEKWRDVLAREHFDFDADDVERAARRLGGPRVVVFDGWYNSPETDAGSARMTMILSALARWGRAELIVNPPHLAPATEQLLGRAGVRLLSQEDFEEGARGGGYFAAILSRPLTARGVLPVLRRLDPKIKIIYDTVDIHFVRLEREYKLTGDAQAAREMILMKEDETRLASQSDQVWCATPSDKEFLERETRAASIKVVPTIHAPRGRGKSFEERSGLLFIGNFNHRPNVDAVHYFVKEIFPSVRAAVPGAVFHVVGTNTPDEIAAYHSQEIVVAGYVPDVTQLFEGCRVFVAPLRYGAGMKGKIGQALSFGLPIVTTSIGAEGIGLTHGRDVLVADDARGFADAVVGLYGDADTWQRLSDNGYAHVSSSYSPEVVGPKIVAALEELCGAETPAAPALRRRAASLD